MCIGEQPLWCGVVEFDWSFKHRAAEPVVTNNGDTIQCTIQITLSTRLHSIYHEESARYLDIPLQDHLRNHPPPSEAPFSWAPLYVNYLSSVILMKTRQLVYRNMGRRIISRIFN